MDMRFEQAVASILERDRRFDAAAYDFLRESLDFTLKRIADANKGRTRHIAGPELLRGFRDYTLGQFGPMGWTLMAEWGVRKCRDIGDMVFLLIEEEMFGRQESDRPEDFAEIFDFQEELTKPFLPRAGAIRAGAGATHRRRSGSVS